MEDVKVRVGFESAEAGRAGPLLHEKVIPRSLLFDQYDIDLPGWPQSVLRDALAYADAAYVVTADAWVDNGIRDEEGWPAVFEEPAVYLQICVRDCDSNQMQWCRSIPAADVPLLAYHLSEQIDEAIETATRETHEWLERLGAAIKSVENQRSRIQELKWTTSSQD